MIDIASLHDEQIPAEALEAASERLWKPLSGQSIRLRDMQWSHLMRSLRMVRRNLNKVKDAQDESLCYADDTIGFTGYENDIAVRSALLHLFILEVHRRLRAALSKAQAISAEETLHLRAADLAPPNPKDVNFGLLYLDETPDPAPVRHPEDGIPF